MSTHIGRVIIGGHSIGIVVSESDSAATIAARLLTEYTGILVSAVEVRPLLTVGISAAQHFAELTAVFPPVPKTSKHQYRELINHHTAKKNRRYRW